MEPSRTRLKASSRQLILCCVIILTVAGLIVFSHPRLVNASSSLTFIPVADSYVNQSDPTRNYGNSTSIRVDGSPLVHAYLRFDVIGIDTNPVTKVTLKIYANSSSSAGFTVNKVEDNNWDETGITYNNAPAPGSQVGASSSFSGNTWIDIDVTPLLNNDGMVSIVLLGINQTAINLAARENSNYAPQLLVEISEPGTATATQIIEPSATATWTLQPSNTATATASPSPSNTPMPTATSSPSPSSTPTLTSTASSIPSSTLTATPSPLPSSTSTPTATAPPVPSTTPSPTDMASPIPSSTPTPTTTASPIPSSTLTPTATASPIPSSTLTPTATASPIPSATPTPLPSNTSTPTATASPIPSSTPTPTASPAPSSTPTPTATASPFPSSTPTPTTTASPISSSTLTFVPVADSYVNQSDPTRNYGSKLSLRVDGYPLVYAYLRFDVIGIDSNPVTKVTLKIYASSSSSAGFTVNKVQDNSWEETAITYNNAPAPGSQVGFSNSFSGNTWVEIDVTPLLNNDGTVSIVLLGINQTAINLAARENSSYAPQILVEISEPGEATATWTLQPSSTATPTDLPSATSTAPPISSTTPTPTGTTSPVPSSTPTPTVTGMPSPSFTPTQTPTSAPTNDPIIFFVGDLVSGTSVSRAQAVVDLIQTLMSQHPSTQMLVASVGDNEQESSPTISNYESYFGTTYGTFVTQGIFMQVRGNHDIQSAGSYTDFDGQVHSTGAAYWDYFGPDAHMFDIDGKKLTDYSYDLGSWHIVALDQLNGNVNQHTLDFLTTDLAIHAGSTCQMVYWHVPTYSSGAVQGDKPGLKPLNQAEYDAGVDIQLNGHDHDYQRFFPINPDGVQDDDYGITTFVVGIGGQDGNSGSQTSIAQAASAVYLDTFPPENGHAIGVVQFTLHADSADYKLYDANDGSILDQGTVMCH